MVTGVEFFLIDADYVITQGGVTQVRLFGRDVKGTPVVVLYEKFLPYFYMLAKHSPEKLIEQLGGISVGGRGFEKLEVVEKVYNGAKVEAVKGTLRTPPDVPVFRELVRKCGELEERLETDVPFVKKFMIENGMSPLGKVLAHGEDVKDGFGTGTIVVKAEKLEALLGGGPYEPKVLSFDIEVYCPKGSPRPRHDPITMISLAGPGMKKVLTWRPDKSSKAPGYVEVLDDEAAVIRRFVKIVEEYDPDAIVGYNSDAFDFPYIRDRSRVHKIRLVLGRDGSEVGFVRRGPTSAATTFGRLLLDVYPFVDNIVSRGMRAESLDLGTVAQELLGTGKTGLGYEDMIRKWQEGHLAEMYEYSLKDSVLVEMLSEKLLPMAFEFARLTRSPIFDAIRMTSGQIVEWFLMSRAYGANIIAPNHPMREDVVSRRSATYVGGYVRTPEVGLHDNIAVLDYRSLYPSIIISHNIDPATIDCECCQSEKEDVHFCSKKKGFMPTVLREVLEKRLELKDLLKKAKKGTLEYRVLDARQQALKQVANSFYGYMGFAGARWYCLKCAEATTALGRMYIQQTIDAAEKDGFRVLYADTDSCFLSTPGVGGIEKKAGDFLEGINRTLPETMELELQGIYRRGVFVTKKRYAMLASDGTIVVKGLERVRRDWAPIAKDTQEAVLRALLEKADPKEAARLVRDAVKRLRERRVSKEDVTILTQLTKDPENYELTAPHVEAAKKMIAKGREARAGVLIRFIVKKGRGSISERSYPAEDVTIDEYDPEYYVNNQVLPAALRIMEALGFKEAEELKSEQKKLGEFS